MKTNVIDTALTSLQTTGFVVIRDFLSSQEIQFLLDDYHNQGTADNLNYSLVNASPETLKQIEDKFGNVITGVVTETDIAIDVESQHVGLYWANKPGNALSWHQDHESFYVIQNHYDYLNFYIPIQKPKKEKSNLMIIPWDRLKTKSFSSYEKLVRNGGNSFQTIGKRTVVTSDKGITTIFPFSLDSIAHTPELDAGDLLIIRGDVIHRTQDTDTDRIALTLRFTDPNTKVSRWKLLAAGKRKTKKIKNNWLIYAPFIKAFEICRQNTLTWVQLKSIAQELTSKYPELNDRSVAHSYLVSQQLASGAIIEAVYRRFTAKCASIYISNLGRKDKLMRITKAVIAKVVLLLKRK